MFYQESFVRTAVAKVGGPTKTSAQHLPAWHQPLSACLGLTAEASCPMFVSVCLVRGQDSERIAKANAAN